MRITFEAYDELKPLTALVDSRYQRNKHPPEQIKRLAKIMEAHGVRHPIHVVRGTNEICFGHGRREAAKLNGYTDYPIVYQDFESDEEMYATVQSDNAIAMWAELDLGQINIDLEQLGPDFDLDLLGIEDFVLEPAEKLPMCDEDEIPEHVEPKTKLGDLYKLGEHRLLCGDSTNIDHVERLMDGEKADFTITSPPYNVGLDYNEYEDKKSEDDYVDMIKSVLGNMRTICTEDFCLLWNVGVYPLSLHLSLLRDFFNVHRSIAWIKQGVTGPPLAYQMKKNPVVKNYLPNFGWEIIACCYLNRKLKGKRKIPIEVIDESISDVWQISQHSNSKDQGKHPGAFPVKIAERSILLYAENIVYEPFGGSGSTLIAAEKTNRKCYSMELDPHYCDVIVARWEKYSGKKAELIS